MHCCHLIAVLAMVSLATSASIPKRGLAPLTSADLLACPDEKAACDLDPECTACFVDADAPDAFDTCDDLNTWFEELELGPGCYAPGDEDTLVTNLLFCRYDTWALANDLECEVAATGAPSTAPSNAPSVAPSFAPVASAAPVAALI